LPPTPPSTPSPPSSRSATPIADTILEDTTGTTTNTAKEKEPCGTPKTPWISCPFHKRNFDLGSGSCSNDASLSIATFDAEERPDGLVYLLLPPVEELDAELGTTRWKVKKGEDTSAQFEELDKKIAFKGRRAKKVGAGGVRSIMTDADVQVLPKKGVMMGGSGGGCGGAPEW
jgi:nitrite reductase (NAD(P)H)